MRYGEITKEEVAEALVSMGFTQRMETVGVMRPTRFEITGIEGTNEFWRGQGSERVEVTVNCDIEWDKHVKVRMASEPCTVDRFYIMGREGSDFVRDVEAMIERAATQARR